jgi:hypothetical protein
MPPIREDRGFTLIDISVVLLMLGIALGLTAPMSRRIIARFELNSAAQTLTSDLEYAKIRAIQSNAVTVLWRETARDYRVDGRPRRLPAMVRFGDASVDSLRFNGLGATVDSGIQRLVLENSLGERLEVRVFSSGGYEVEGP